MTATPTTAGGLHCFEVLARLSDYVDGDLQLDERAKVDAHLRACDACTRFGSHFSHVVSAVRQHLGAERDAPTDVAARLATALPLDD